MANLPATTTIRVEVAYAEPQQQVIMVLDLPTPCTLQHAIAQSGILQQFPQLDLSRNKVGIFGKVKPLDTLLQAHDRVEIYRPLRADPKDLRRQRAARNQPLKTQRHG